MFAPVRTVLVSVAVSLFLFAAAGKLRGQSNTSAIVGTCSDSSGAGIPKAAVQARELSTNLRFEAKTNGDGYYVIPTLPVGSYTVT
jgi:hypothetical protein